MNPVKIDDPYILGLLEKERAIIESRYNMPDNKDISPCSLFAPLDSSCDISNAKHTNKIIQIDKPSCVDDLIDYSGLDVCSNAVMYLPSSLMAWHTNSNMDGNRCYITYSYGNSVFRYQNEHGEIVDSHDIPNAWQVRRFKIPQDDLLWHTIACSGSRITYGFRDGA